MITRFIAFILGFAVGTLITSMAASLILLDEMRDMAERLRSLYCPDESWEEFEEESDDRLAGKRIHVADEGDQEDFEGDQG